MIVLVLIIKKYFLIDVQSVYNVVATIEETAVAFFVIFL